jgi:WD40 repeat protein
VDNAHVLTAAADAQKVNVQKDLADSQAREKRTAYFRNILLADREFHGGDADRARQLLADCTTDLRQWEWYYLNYRLNDPNAEEYLRRTGPEQPISTILFSPDGRWLAAASAGDDPDPKPDVRIWDATAPDAVHVLTGFRAPVHGMAFNPDGKRLATVASAHNNFGEAVGELKEWDPAKGELLDVLALNNAQPADAAYSSDGKRLVVVDDDGKLHAFTPGGKGEIALNLQTAADWAPRTFHLALLSPDGGKVAVVAAGGLDVQIYDTTRARTATRAAHHADEITALTFSPETNLLASAGRDGTLMIWDVTANRSVTPAALHAHIGAVTGASFTRDGRRLATSGEDGFVRIWDPATGQEVYQFQPFDAGDSITAVRFSPAKNDERLAAAHGTEVRIFGPPRP